jgi:hypothetical protein
MRRPASRSCPGITQMRRTGSRTSGETASRSHLAADRTLPARPALGRMVYVRTGVRHCARVSGNKRCLASSLTTGYELLCLALRNDQRQPVGAATAAPAVRCLRTWAIGCLPIGRGWPFVQSADVRLSNRYAVSSVRNPYLDHGEWCEIRTSRHHWQAASHLAWGTGVMARANPLEQGTAAGEESQKRAPRVPDRAHLPLLPSDPGGVG